MESTRKNYQGKCGDNLSQKKAPIKEACWSILDNTDAINEEGCRFFVEAKSSQPTCISTVLPNMPFGSREKGICNSHPIDVETCQGASLFFCVCC